MEAKRRKGELAPLKLHNATLAPFATAEHVRSMYTFPDYEAIQRALDARPRDPTPEERLTQWLRNNDLEHLADRLLAEEVDLPALALLDTRDLLDLGLPPADASALLAAVAAHPPDSLSDHDEGPDCEDAKENGPGARAGLGGPKVETRITDFFRTASGAVLRPRDVNAAPASTSAATGRESDKGNMWKNKRRRLPPPPPPYYKRVPGTSFVVDGFDCDCSQLQTRSFFLTHFHTDHTKGLGARWDRGLIYCTQVTARLVEKRLKVSPEFLRPLPCDRPVTVEGVQVTLLDANHCPGAAMVVFERSGMPPVLHSGDLRFHPDMCTSPVLQSLRGRCVLYLDTTYCDPKYDFPKQEEVVQQIVQAVKLEEFNTNSAKNAGTLFLFGTYTIGKERVFLEVAKALRRPVFVGPSKREILECLDLTPEERSLLTTDEQTTNLQAVGTWTVKMKKMAGLLKYYRGRFTTVIGFEPVGWTYAGGAGAGGAAAANKTDFTHLRKSSNRDKGTGTILHYAAPYSEHSSFPELRQMVAWLRPTKVIPTVANDGSGGMKTKRMLELLGVGGG